MLPITGGSVDVDQESATRRTLNCTVSDPTGDLIPSDVYSPAAPYGAYVRPYRGVRYDDGTEELIPQGVFRLTDATIRDDGAPGLTLKGYDRSRKIARNKFTVPYVIFPGTPYTSAIPTLIQDRLGEDVELQVADAADVAPLTVFDAEDDPWQHAQDMAKAYGAECFFDQDGAFVLRDQQDPSDFLVIAVYASGEDPSTQTPTAGARTSLPAAPVLIDLERALSDDPGYNGVVMVSESTTLPGGPIRSEVWDLNPDSPTYALGPYGRVPAFQSSPYITSQDSADKAARAWLLKNLGGTETVQFSIVPDPALDAGDVVRVIREQSHVQVVGVIQQLSVPFAVDEAMSISLRPRLSLVTA